MLTLYRGDDYPGQVGKTLTINLKIDDTVDITGLKAYFEFYDIKKEFINLTHDNKWDIAISHNQSKKYPLGVSFAKIYSLDPSGKIRTFANRIPVLVTTDLRKVYGSDGLDSQDVHVYAFVAWESITNKPTTLEGFGITDAASKSELNAESQRAQDAESFVKDKINEEVTRAKAREDSLERAIASIQVFDIVVADSLPIASEQYKRKMYLVPSSDPKTSNVRDEYVCVNIDNVWTWEKVGSTSVSVPVTSVNGKTGAVILTAHDISYGEGSNVETAIAEAEENINTNAGDIDSLEQQLTEHIDDKNNPHEVTANQVGTYDRSTIDDKINQFAAHYITADAAGNAFATKSALTSATVFYYAGEEITPTKNDYAVVLNDSDHNNATTRYVYVGVYGEDGQFQYQYSINSTAFTPEQWAALDSGATKDKIDSIESKLSADDVVPKLSEGTEIAVIAGKSIRAPQGGGAGGDFLKPNIVVTSYDGYHNECYNGDITVYDEMRVASVYLNKDKNALNYIVDDDFRFYISKVVMGENYVIFYGKRSGVDVEMFRWQMDAEHPNGRFTSTDFGNSRIFTRGIYNLWSAGKATYQEEEEELIETVARISMESTLSAVAEIADAFEQV